ncbi:E3 ubiquitin-protein ligase RNF186-like [Bombina bombina]|uniref:E3 ubiquitin-protein ligase RNF186-like n=1 Tax=Bombina bombina TaxID=8345 RepID=UPI00235AE19D|nr:E3 ubiquitin-protein ligase RNF186-like [Bombina bombina]
MELPSLESQKDSSSGECSICYEAYKTHSKSRSPKTLQCGHSLCVCCLKKLVCHSLLLSFVVCPFCRRVTIIPEEGVQALKTDEETLRRSSVSSVVTNTSNEEHSGCSHGSNSPSLLIGREYTHLPTIFTISEVVAPDQGQIWGGRYMQEVQNTYLLGINRRVALSEAHPSPARMSTSADRLRLCFALGLILSIACIFFILIFFK